MPATCGMVGSALRLRRDPAPPPPLAAAAAAAAEEGEGAKMSDTKITPVGPGQYEIRIKDAGRYKTLRGIVEGQGLGTSIRIDGTTSYSLASRAAQQLSVYFSSEGLPEERATSDEVVLDPEVCQVTKVDEGVYQVRIPARALPPGMPKRAVVVNVRTPLSWGGTSHFGGGDAIATGTSHAGLSRAASILAIQKFEAPFYGIDDDDYDEDDGNYGAPYDGNYGAPYDSDDY